MKIRHIFALLLLVLFCIPAIAQEIIVELEYDSINIERHDFAGVTLTITNNSDDGICFELDTESSYEEITATVLADEFCLNKGETTKFTFTIVSSENAEEGSYNVNVEIKYDENEIEKVIGVNVLDLADIELEAPSDVVFCKEGYTKYIEIDVLNLGSSTEEVMLFAESELFLPVFEPNTVELDAGETRTVDLKIHINNTTSLGYYTIPIYVTTGEGYVERNASFELIECTKRYFNLYVVDDEIDIEKEDSETIRFTVTSLYDKEQTIRLSSTGDLPNSLDFTSVTLDAGESATGFLTVSARMSDSDGEHIIKLYAWNEYYEDVEEVIVNVESEHLVEIEVLNNDLEQRICSAIDFEVFEVEITNKGDLREEINLSVEDDYESISIDISDESFDLEEGETKTVYIAVQPGYDAELGAKTVYLIVEDNGGDEIAREALNFTIVEAEDELIEGVIEVVNYPRNITMKQGEEKDVSITVRNTTNETIEDIRIKLWGAGSGIYFNTYYLVELQPSETKTIEGTLGIAENTATGTYSLTLEVKADNSITAKDVTLYIEHGENQLQEEEIQEEEVGFAGLFTLIGAGGILLGLTILIVLFIIYLMYLLLKSAKNYSSNRTQA